MPENGTYSVSVLDSLCPWPAGNSGTWWVVAHKGNIKDFWRLEPQRCGGRVWPAASPQHPHPCGSSGKEPFVAGRQAGWLPPESAHKRIKVLLSGRHWVGWLIIHFSKVWFFPPLCKDVCSCVCGCACYRTVCRLYVLTDGSSLIFYPVLQKIKLKLSGWLPLRFKGGGGKKTKIK